MDDLWHLWNCEPDLAELDRIYDLRATNPKQALLDYKALSERGSTMSMAYLGDLYRRGVGTDVSLEEAVRWYQRATAAGCTRAFYNIGMIHYRNRNYTGAREAFERGAVAGNTGSMVVLGIMDGDGHGGAKNIQQARFWFEKACGLGNLDAKVRLGKLLIRSKFGVFQKWRGIRLIIGGFRGVVTAEYKKCNNIKNMQNE